MNFLSFVISTEAERSGEIAFKKRLNQSIPRSSAPGYSLQGRV